MKTIIAAALAFALVSGSAFAQDGKTYKEVTPEQSQAAAQAKLPAEKQVTPSINVEELAKQKLGEWQQKKRKCFIDAGLIENTHFRQNPDNPTNFQIKESVYLTTGFNVPAIVKCRDMKS